MNKLTSQRQTVISHIDNEAPYQSSGGALDDNVSLATGHFVRIRTMLLAPRKPVKRRWPPKTPLPNKPAGCPASLFINRAAVSPQGGALARLYANGILGPPVQRDVCSTTIWPPRPPA